MNNKLIALNILYAPYSTKEISQNNLQRENEVIL